MTRIIKAKDASEMRFQAWKPMPLESALEGCASPTAASSFHTKTLPADSAAFHVDASQEVAAAKAEAEAIRQAAREQGLAEGREASRQALEKQLAELKKQAEELEAERSSFFDRMEPEVARLAVTIAEKVIAKELEVHPEVVVGLVRIAMRRVRDREMIRVRVNPDDVPILRARRGMIWLPKSTAFRSLRFLMTAG